MTKITYEDLRKCNSLARSVREKKEKLEWLDSLAAHCTATIENSGRGTKVQFDKIGEMVAEIDNNRWELVEAIEAYWDHIGIVRGAIARIPDETQQAIMRMRYLDGLTWREISSKTHYVDSWCRKQEAEGLCAMGITRGR